MHQHLLYALPLRGMNVSGRPYKAILCIHTCNLSFSFLLKNVAPVVFAIFPGILIYGLFAESFHLQSTMLQFPFLKKQAFFDPHPPPASIWFIDSIFTVGFMKEFSRLAVATSSPPIVSWIYAFHSLIQHGLGDLYA